MTNQSAYWTHQRVTCDSMCKKSSSQMRCVRWSLSAALAAAWLLTLCDGIYIDTPPKDLIVEEGRDARFLCLTSVLPRSEGQQALISVHWTFRGQRLHGGTTSHDGDSHGAPARILMAEETTGERSMKSTESHKPRFVLRTFENRHVLIINEVRPEDEGEYACVVTYGNESERAEGSLTIKRIPEAPEDVGVRCHGNTAEVTWRPGKSKGAYTSSYLVQYNLMESPEEWFSYYEDTVGTGTSAYIELAPYGVYSFRVIARNRFGESAPSAPTQETCTTPPDRPDRNPRHVRSRTDKKGYLVIEWEPLHRLSFHGNGFGYVVMWRRKGTYGYKSAQVNGSYASTFSQEVDDVYGLYEFRVRSRNSLGLATHPSLVYLGHSFESEPEVIVDGFQVDTSRPVAQDTAHFVWEAVDPKDTRIHGKFKGYKIIYWKWATQDQPKQEVFIPYSGRMDGRGPVKGEQVTGSISGLPAFSNIKAQLAVVNTHYTGPPSITVDVFTPEGRPSEVKDLHVDKMTHNSVVIRWLPPDQPNGVLQGFDVGYQSVMEGGHLGHLKVVGGRSSSSLRLEARIHRLEPNHWYRIHVAARTRAGRGELAVMDVRTNNNTSPSVSSSSPSNGTLYRAHNDPPGQQLSGSDRSASVTVHSPGTAALTYYSCLVMSLTFGLSTRVLQWLLSS